MSTVAHNGIPLVRDFGPTFGRPKPDLDSTTVEVAEFSVALMAGVFMFLTGGKAGLGGPKRILRKQNRVPCRCQSTALPARPRHTPCPPVVSSSGGRTRGERHRQPARYRRLRARLAGGRSVSAE